MDTPIHDDTGESPSRKAADKPPSQGRGECSDPRRTSVVIVDRTRLTRESLLYFLQAQAPDLDVRAVEEAAGAAEEPAEPPDVVLVKAASVDQAAVRQAASELETAFGRRIPTILILQGDDAALDELKVIRLGMQGCFPAGLGACMLIAAIRLVSSGGVFLSPQAITLLASRQAGNGEPLRTIDGS